MAVVDSRPITEQSNPITANIDVSSPRSIVRLLNQCDAQIFSGWGSHDSIYCDNVVQTMVEIACLAADIIKDQSEKTMIVLSGCGTSGRLAFMISRTFNLWLKGLRIQRKLYKYLIAGGDKALFRSQEAPEDSYQAGIDALCNATFGMKRVLFIGITCGLSAPFVAGQLNYCMQHIEVFVPVLLGFNPTALARQTPILGWDRTFSNVVQDLELLVHDKKGFILNPVLGPEAITGSTRMKSGTATKMLLEAIFCCAHHMCEGGEAVHSGAWKIRIKRCLQCFELVYRNTYLHGDMMGDFVQIGGSSLTAREEGGGHIYYLGTSSLGVMAMIDASECPPTFGSASSDVRAFLLDSYKTLGNDEGDLEHFGSDYCIGWGEFQAQVLPTLTAADAIVLVLEGKFWEIEAVQVLCKKLKPYNVSCLVVFSRREEQKSTKNPLQGKLKVEVELDLPWSSLGMLWPFHWNSYTAAMFEQLSVKLILNAMTTGAHIIKGKVLGNKMADLQVSNTKLYYRAIGIIQDFSGIERKEAEMCLLSSIYGIEPVGDSIYGNDVTTHVKMATGKSKVVPKALLLASKQVGLAEASHLLQLEPVVRKALSKFQENQIDLLSAQN